MAYITLERTKKHCNVDFTDDDDYITDLIDVAENVLAIELEQPLDELENEGEIPKGLQHGIVMLVKHFYDNREPVVMGTITAKVPYTLEWIISAYKNYTIR